jgi:hypothetical protein
LFGLFAAPGRKALGGRGLQKSLCTRTRFLGTKLAGMTTGAAAVNKALIAGWQALVSSKFN